MATHYGDDRDPGRPACAGCPPDSRTSDPCTLDGLVGSEGAARVSPRRIRPGTLRRTVEHREAGSRGTRARMLRSVGPVSRSVQAVRPSVDGDGGDLMDRGAGASTAVVVGASGLAGPEPARVLVAEARRAERIRCLVRTTDEGVCARGASTTGSRWWRAMSATRSPIDALFDGVGPTSRVPRRGGHPSLLRSVREMFDVNVGGTQLVLDRARRGRCPAASCTSPSNSPFGANSAPVDGALRRGLAVPPVPRLRRGPSWRRRSWSPGALRGAGDLATRRHPPAALVLRTVPARPADGVLRGRAPWPVPTGRARNPTAVDGVHARPRAGLPPRRSAAGVRRPGNVYWIADAEPYELRTILETVRALCRGRGSGGLGVAGSDDPALVVMLIAARADAVLQAAGRYANRSTCSVSCGTRSPATSRAGWRRISTSSRPSACSKECGPAFAGASTVATSSDAIRPSTAADTGS